MRASSWGNQKPSILSCKHEVRASKRKEKQPDSCNTNNNHQSHGEQKERRDRLHEI
jgi:hypothetical protein